AFSIAIVGNAGGTNVGQSLWRAALAAGHRVQFFDSLCGTTGPRLLKSVCWHLADRRPLRLKRVSGAIVHACARTRPEVVIASGTAPLTASALHALRALGICCINFATDDPWNPVQRSNWHLLALPAFDLVFTPRYANIDNFRQIGCPD